MKRQLIASTIIAFTVISANKAHANSPECEQAIKDTNFIYTLMEDHVYLKWAMTNDFTETVAQKKIIDNNAKSLEKYCQLSKPNINQIQVRMSFINQAWYNIKKFSE
jgi:translation initiation factor IF-2